MDKAVLFGIGKKYRKYTELLHKKYNVVSLCDNDISKHGNVIDGYKIVPPDYLRGGNYDVVVILPELIIAETIFQQLLQYGIPTDKIEVFEEGGSIRLCSCFIDEESRININIDSLGDYHVAREIFLYKEYEGGFNAENVVVIDMGMNIGCASLYFASFPNIKCIYSFELVESTFQKALKNIGLNPVLAQKIIPHNFGISNREERILVNTEVISGKTSVFTSPAKSRIECVIKDASAILKPILENHSDSKILLKMDTEGSEYDIFDSLDKSGLLSRIDFIIGEWHNILGESVCLDSDTQKPLLDKLRSHFTRNGFAYKITNVHQGIGYFYACNTCLKG